MLTGMTIKSLFRSLPFLALVGCAGTQRSCNDSLAKTLGADWVVVQYKADGDPINCWQLRDASVANEQGSDGIWWASGSGHLIHVSGWYSRVQVNHGDWSGAAREVGVDLDRCKGGRYLLAKGTP